MRKKFRKGTSFVLSTLLSVMMVFGNFTMPVMAEGDNLDKTPAEEITSEATLNETSPSTSEITSEKSSENSSEQPSETTSETTSELKTEVSSEVTPKLLAGGLLGASGTMSGNGTAEDPFIIEDADDWNTFAAKVEAGTGADAYYKLGADGITVTTTVGTSENPFAGHFDGDDKTLNVNISDTGVQGTAPFRYIANATIQNLTVTGSVTSDKEHAAGLVGFNLREENGGAVDSTIQNCTVSVAVTGTTHAGGIVGHGKYATLNLNNCIFDGSLTSTATGTSNYGGLVGWNDNSTLNISNSLFTGTCSDNVANFHPVTLKYSGKTVNGTYTNVYYTVSPKFADNQYNVGKNAGVLVGETKPAEGEGLYKTVQVAESDNYYLIYSEKGLEGEIHVGNTPYKVEDSTGNALAEGTDYIATIKKGTAVVNEITEEGTYTIEIAPAEGSNLQGSITKEFEVLSALTYQDFDDTTMEFTTKEIPAGYKVVDSTMDQWESETWYVVTGDVTINNRIKVGRNTRLVLCDGAKLTAKQGTEVCRWDQDSHWFGAILIIYGQENNSGQFISTTTLNRNAGIGGGNRNNNSKDVVCGDVIINGGTITAKGGPSGSGIGGGGYIFEASGLDENGKVIINGGIVNATGGETGYERGAAGIGGGVKQISGEIYIRGGKINATGIGGAGIGNGPDYGRVKTGIIQLDWYSTDGLELKTNGFAGEVKLSKSFREKGKEVYFNQSGEETYHDIAALGNKTLVPYDGTIHTLTIDPNNGAGTTKKDYQGSPVIELPEAPSKVSDQWRFVGWQLGENTELHDPGDEFTLDSDITAKAIWECTVVISSADHGTVTAKTDWAKKGDTVELTVEPDSDHKYIVSYIEVEYTENGQTNTKDAWVDNTNPKLYKFMMPNAPVTIRAKFKVDLDAIPLSWDGINPVLTWNEAQDVSYYTITAKAGNSIAGSLNNLNIGNVTSYDCTAAVHDYSAWDIDYYVKGYATDDVQVAEGHIRSYFHPVKVIIRTMNSSGDTIDSDLGGTVKLTHGDHVNETTKRETYFYYLKGGNAEVTLNMNPGKGYKTARDGEFWVVCDKHSVWIPDGSQINIDNWIDQYGDESGRLEITAYFKEDITMKNARLHLGNHGNEADKVLEVIKEKYDASAVISAMTSDYLIEYHTLQAQTVEELMADIDGIMKEVDLSEEKLGYRIGLAETYQDMNDYTADINAKKDIRISEYTGDLYIQWLPVVEEVNISDLAAPVCGTDIDPDTGAGKPSFTIAESDKITSERQVWVNADGGTISGTVKGGDEFVAAFDLYPTFHYTVSEETVVKVDGVNADVTVLEDGGLLVKKSVIAEHNFVNNICTECQEKKQPKLNGHSVLLTGQIGLTFWFDLPEVEGNNYQDVEFTVTGRNGGKQVVAFSDATYDPEKGYGFTCKLNVLQMAQPVNAVLHYKDGSEDKTIESSYSVENYITDFNEKKDQYDEKTQKLVYALNDYGFYCQKFLMDYHGIYGSGDNTYVTMSDAYVSTYNPVAYQKNVFENNYSVKRELKADLEELTSSANFESEVTLYINIKKAEGYDGTMSVTVDEQAYTPVLRSDGRYRVEIKNIPAQDFGKVHRVEVETESGKSTIAVSIIDYMSGAFFLTNPSGNPFNNAKGKNAAIATYEFYKAAENYLN